MTKLQKILTF